MKTGESPELDDVLGARQFFVGTVSLIFYLHFNEGHNRFYSRDEENESEGDIPFS